MSLNFHLCSEPCPNLPLLKEEVPGRSWPKGTPARSDTSPVGPSLRLSPLWEDTSGSQAIRHPLNLPDIPEIHCPGDFSRNSLVARPRVQQCPQGQGWGSQNVQVSCPSPPPGSAPAPSRICGCPISLLRIQNGST